MPAQFDNNLIKNLTVATSANAHSAGEHKNPPMIKAQRGADLPLTEIRSQQSRG